MINFYQKHSKLISVLLTAVFVVGGVILMQSSIVSAANPTSLFPRGEIYDNSNTTYQLYSDIEGNYYISLGPATNTGGQEYFEINRSFGQLLEDQINSGRGSSSITLDSINRNIIDRNKPQLTNADLFGNKPLDQEAADQRQVDLAGTAGTKLDPAQLGAKKLKVEDPKEGLNTLERILGNMIAWLLYYIALGLGYIFMLITKVMLTVAVFNSFLSQPAVQVGWTITRDICNNFFIVFMMILAAGVTLHLPSYAWRTMLPKILIYAVVINFSMTITGVLIDVSQVLMLTFASPLATANGYGIILTAFGMPDAFNAAPNIPVGAGGFDLANIIAALLFAVIVTIVAIVVVTCIAVILVYRIIMLMFLVILSPLYFLSKASNISALNAMGSEWMSKLSGMLAVGPAMMFFLYLSFLTMASVNNLGANGNNTILDDAHLDAQISAGQTRETGYVPVSFANNGNGSGVDISKMATLTGVINFLVVVGLLWASLMMGKKFGDAAGQFAGKGMGWLSGAAKKYSGFNLANKGVAKLKQAPGAVVSAVGAKVGTGALGTTTGMTRAAGWAAGKVGLKTVSEGLGKLGDVGTQWRQDVLGGRRKARIAKLGKVLGKVGLGSDEAKQKWGEFTDTDLAKRSKQALLTAKSGVIAGAGLAAGGLTTGGVGLVAGLSAAAAGYLGGGGRLMEIALGQKGIARAKAREEEQMRINEAKSKTASVIESSEQKRDKDAEAEIDSLTVGTAERARRDLAIKRMADIDSAKLTKKNRKNGNGLDPEITGALSRNGWRPGNEITDEMLKAAKSDVRGSNFWSDQNKAISDFDTKFAPEIQRIKQAKENDHVSRVKNDLHDLTELETTKSGKSLRKAEEARFVAEYGAKANFDAETARIKRDLEIKLRGIDLSLTNPMTKLRDKEKAQADADANLSKATNTYAKQVADAQPKEPKARAIDKFLDDYKPYAHENWASQGVAKDAQKMQQAVKDLVAAMEGAGSDVLDGQLSRSSFYSTNGQTETQFKSIKAMIDSTKATQNLIDALSAMPKEISGEQAQLVKELKQGLAAFKKGGGDTTKLAAIIALLDQKKGFNKDGTKVIDDKSVADYESEVKPKK